MRPSDSKYGSSVESAFISRERCVLDPQRTTAVCILAAEEGAFHCEGRAPAEKGLRDPDEPLASRSKGWASVCSNGEVFHIEHRTRVFFDIYFEIRSSMPDGHRKSGTHLRMWHVSRAVD